MTALSLHVNSFFVCDFSFLAFFLILKFIFFSNMGSSEEFQKTLSQEFDKMKNIQKDLQKAVAAKQTLDGQLSENKVVQEELEFLTPENKVYKMTGPVLVQQDIEEAKQNVEKRIMFITTELKRNEELLKELGGKQDKQQEILQRLQKEFTETQMKGIKK